MSRKSLIIPFLPPVKTDPEITEISRLLEKREKHAVGTAPWPEFNDRPLVQFSIAHNGDAILLKYDVEEAETLARYTQPNDPVYRDSCVEFFIAFDDGGYYNLEFNSLGTCLGAYGPDRNNRTAQSPTLLQTIQYHTETKHSGKPLSAWSLTVAIPLAVFSFHSFASLQGITCRANFYKCGDDLQQSHYLVWNNIEWPEPNFHLPEFFGEVEFL